MRKRMWLAAAVVVLLSGATGLWGSTVQAADNHVAMTDQLKFEPATITVQAGTTVVWQNDGDAQHDVMAKDGSFKSNGMLNKGETFQFKFTTPGATYEYICTPHESAGMTGVVKVLGGGSTPTTAASTTTTTSSTATTAAPGATTTTTAKAAAGTGSSTTTTTAAANGATSTTLAPSVTPTSAPDTAGESTTTAVGQAGGDEAAADHGSEGGAHNKKENSPIGIAFALMSTLLLAAIAGKLLASKP
jgi:plastocyanin